jgi:hypothetical protein
MTATLRPFDWRDLTVLHRYRAQGLCLDAALSITRGSNLAPSVLLSYLTPVTGIFTWVCANDHDKQPLMGQITHAQDETFARLSFLAPEEALESPSLFDLLEQLAQRAGESGAFNLLAEIDEKSIAFEPLRRAGFAIYARQRIWKLTENRTEIKPDIPWIAASSSDMIGVQILYHNVVPGLVQQVEPLSSKQVGGLVCHYDGEIIGYVDLKYGSQGIWAQPFIHPDVEDVESRLRDLLPSFHNQRGRAVYLCVRSYQSWLEPALEALDAQPGPLQAVLVKRLAVQQRSAKPFALPQIDGQREITTPISQSKQNGTSIPHVTKS